MQFDDRRFPNRNSPTELEEKFSKFCLDHWLFVQEPEPTLVDGFSSSFRRSLSLSGSPFCEVEIDARTNGAKWELTAILGVAKSRLSPYVLPLHAFQDGDDLATSGSSFLTPWYDFTPKSEIFHSPVGVVGQFLPSPIEPMERLYTVMMTEDAFGEAVQNANTAKKLFFNTPHKRYAAEGLLGSIIMRSVIEASLRAASELPGTRFDGFHGLSFADFGIITPNSINMMVGLQILRLKNEEIRGSEDLNYGTENGEIYSAKVELDEYGFLVASAKPFAA